MARTSTGKNGHGKISTDLKKSTKAVANATRQLELALVTFKAGGKEVEFNFDLTGETVWATQQQIADAFEISRSTVAEHIKNVFRNKELDEDTSCRKFRQLVPGDREYEVQHYNLDVILSVGYRVSSPKATRFRQWATQTLKSYVIDGFAIDEARLRADPGAANKLAASLRAIRADENNIYSSVRDSSRKHRPTMIVNQRRAALFTQHCKISFILQSRARRLLK
jgi:hypothetical protein